MSDPEPQIPVPDWVNAFVAYTEGIGDWNAKFEEHIELEEMPEHAQKAYTLAIAAATQMALALDRWFKETKSEGH